MVKNKKNDFIELRDVWGRYAQRQILENGMRKLASGYFDLSTLKKLMGKITKKNITMVIMIINIAIPMTFSPVTNPIILKVSEKSDLKAMQKKLNWYMLRFR